MAKDNTIAKNRKAYHDYDVLETLEAGIQLQGTEVKSCRARTVNLADGYAKVENSEVWLHNVHISPYAAGNRNNHAPTRPRRLLLHKREIRKLFQATQQRGLTLIPLAVYLKHGKVKVQLGLCQGRQQHDKRQALKRDDAARTMRQALRRDV